MNEIEAAMLAETPRVVIDSLTRTREVIRRMQLERSGYALVTEGSALRGIFTERDVLTKVLGVASGLERPISDWMSTPPVCLEAGASLINTIRHMREAGFRTMPVKDRRGQILVIRHRHVLRCLVDRMSQHIFTRPPDPDRVVRTREGA